MMKTLLLPLAALTLVACSKQTETPPTPLRPVYSTVVTEPLAETQRRFTGRVAAGNNSQIGFQVGGRVTSITAVPGKSYKQGDILATLDATDYQTQLREAEARLTEARNNLRRIQGLFETGNASKGDLDSAMTGQSSAQANYDIAKKRLDDSTLLMPYDGVVGRVDADPQETVAAGQGIIRLLGEGKNQEFLIGVPDDMITRIEIGMKSTVNLTALGDGSFEGTVSEVGAEPGDNTLYPVRIQFEDPDTKAREGMDGEAALTLHNPSGPVMTIPLSAVAAQSGTPSFVYILEVDGTEAVVSRREVKTGRVAPSGEIEILEGLQSGDRIATKGVNHLEPGARVKLIADQNSN